MEFSDKEILGIGGALASFLGGFLLSGRKVGKFEKGVEKDIQRIDSHLEEHAALISDHSRKIAEQHDELHNDMESIRAFFQTSAGGQKFMTFPDHDLICLRNSQVVVTEIQHLTAAIKGLTEQSAKTSDQVSAMAVEIAVVKAEGKKQ